MRSMVTALAVAIGLLVAGQLGWAQDSDEARARELFKRAEVHFSLGEFDRALKLYGEAYRAKQLPEFLFNIGQCHRHLKNCRKAVFYFKQYLEKEPDSQQRAQVEQLVRGCEAKIAAEEPAEAPEGPNQGLSRAWFWAGVGLTSALVVAGAVTGILARVKNDEYHAADTPIERRAELKDSGEALETTSWITLGVAGAAAVGTAVLYYLTRPRTNSASTTSLSPTLSTTGAGLVLQGRF